MFDIDFSDYSILSMASNNLQEAHQAFLTDAFDLAHHVRYQLPIFISNKLPLIFCIEIWRGTALASRSNVISRASDDACQHGQVLKRTSAFPAESMRNDDFRLDLI
jgi:hypothetical protein